jgi:hypothetical protein
VPWSNDWPSEALGTALLLAAARYAWLAARRVPEGRACWRLAAAGLAWLALDEAFSLHERAGTLLARQGVPTPLGVNHLDDAIVVAYGLGALAFGARYALLLLCQPPAVLVPLLAAAAATATAIAIEARAPVSGWAPVLEESCELAAAALFVAAFRTRARLPAAAAAAVPPGGVARRAP